MRSGSLPSPAVLLLGLVCFRVLKVVPLGPSKSPASEIGTILDENTKKATTVYGRNIQALSKKCPSPRPYYRSVRLRLRKRRPRLCTMVHSIHLLVLLLGLVELPDFLEFRRELLEAADRLLLLEKLLRRLSLSQPHEARRGERGTTTTTHREKKQKATGMGARGQRERRRGGGAREIVERWVSVV